MMTESGQLNNSVAVMVSKQYFERVKDYLLLPLEYQIPWKTLQHLPGGETPIEGKREEAKKNNNYESQSTKVTILDTTETTGNSHSRRGFLVVLFQDVVRPIHQILPIARQNLAWALKLTHQAHFDTGQPTMQEIVNQIMETLPIKDMPLVGNDKGSALRVDIYPKSYTEEICLSLQRVCHKMTSQSGETPDDPFEGPIEMILSASKCSHRLAIIVSTSQQDTESCRVCWGWMDRKVDAEIMDTRVNDFATDEILLVPPVNDYGKDPEGVQPGTPVSRAFYKLDQVWKDFLEPQEPTTLSSIEKFEASAVDFGSAPGGWTQVLASRAKGVNAICSVDRGALGERVLKLPQVKYIKSLVEDGLDQLVPYGPFGILVCDASQLWSELLELFVKVFTGEAPSKRPTFTLPCVFVITMKLPFQTPMSIQRHVDLVNERTPQFLADMAAAMYPEASKVQTRSTVVHLMANSVSERTLLVVFEEASTGAPL